MALCFSPLWWEFYGARSAGHLARNPTRATTPARYAPLRDAGLRNASIAPLRFAACSRILRDLLPATTMRRDFLVLLIGGSCLIALGCAKSSTAPLSKSSARAAIECRTGYFIRGGNSTPVDTVCVGAE